MNVRVRVRVCVGEWACVCVEKRMIVWVCVVKDTLELAEVCVTVFVCICMGEWGCLRVERSFIVVENALAVAVGVCCVFEREV